MVYDICDAEGITELLNSFSENVGNVLHTILHTSPIGIDSIHYFVD